MLPLLDVFFVGVFLLLLFWLVGFNRPTSVFHPSNLDVVQMYRGICCPPV